MTIKDKVLASAKTSFAKYGLKKEELSRLVDQIVANRGLTDESSDEDVTGAVTAFEPMVGLMQTMFNRAVSETSKKFEGWVKPDGNEKENIVPPPPTPPADNLTLEQVQKMLAENAANNQKAISEAVAAAIAPFKEREERQRLDTLFNSHEKVKDIPEEIRSRYQLDKEENLEMLAQQCADGWTAFKQKMAASGMFVEAPKQASPEDETKDFVKKMEEYASRNSESKN